MPGMPTFTGGGSSMGMGPLMPTVNPTAAGLVDQSMNGGLPILPGMGGGPEEMKMNEIMKMILLNGAANGQPLFSMNFGGGKGVRVGGGGGGGMSAGGAAGNMDLMKLLAMVQMMKGQQGTRPGPARGGQQAGPPQ